MAAGEPPAQPVTVHGSHRKVPPAQLMPPAMSPVIGSSASMYRERSPRRLWAADALTIGQDKALLVHGFLGELNMSGTASTCSPMRQSPGPSAPVESQRAFRLWYWIALMVLTGATVLTYRVVLPTIRSLHHLVRITRVIGVAPGMARIEMTARNLERLNTRAGQFIIWRILTPGPLSHVDWDRNAVHSPTHYLLSQQVLRVLCDYLLTFPHWPQNRIPLVKWLVPLKAKDFSRLSVSPFTHPAGPS